MPAWTIALDVVVACLVLVLAFVGYVVGRRRWLSRNGGTFELGVRGSRSGRGWVLGLARYSGSDLEWFRIFSLSLRPRRVLDRGRLVVESRRSAYGSERFALYEDAIVVECRYAGEPLDLALSEKALTGLLAWLEAAPPGRGIART